MRTTTSNSSGRSENGRRVPEDYYFASQNEGELLSARVPRVDIGPRSNLLIHRAELTTGKVFVGGSERCTYYCDYQHIAGGEISAIPEPSKALFLAVACTALAVWHIAIGHRRRKLP